MNYQYINSRLTTHQYRELAEGLLKKAIDAVQNTMSIYDLDVGHPYMKNLSAQEIPLP